MRAKVSFAAAAKGGKRFIVCNIRSAKQGNKQVFIAAGDTSQDVALEKFSLADLRLAALSLDKLHGNVTIFRLLSTQQKHRERTYAATARRFYGRAWKACSCCMIVNHGRVAAALGCLVVCQCASVCA